VGERRSRLEFIAWGLLLMGLVVFFLNFVLNGLDGAGLIWYQVQQAVLDVLTWRFPVYAWVLLPALSVGAYFLRHALPIIEIPLLGASDLEAKVLWRWYWPGSLRVEDAEASWREGRNRAFVNKALITRNGVFGYLIRCTVERNVSEADHEVTYDPAETPAYTSRTLHRRLQREAQERIVQDHRAMREKVQP